MGTGWDIVFQSVYIFLSRRRDYENPVPPYPTFHFSPKTSHNLAAECGAPIGRFCFTTAWEAIACFQLAMFSAMWPLREHQS